MIFSTLLAGLHLSFFSPLAVEGTHLVSASVINLDDQSVLINITQAPIAIRFEAGKRRDFITFQIALLRFTKRVDMR